MEDMVNDNVATAAKCRRPIASRPRLAATVRAFAGLCIRPVTRCGWPAC